MTTAQTSTIFPDTIVFRGYAAPVRAEVDVHDLEVIGTIPPGLHGMYVRNSADHAYPPLFDNDIFLNGDGMIHQVRIADGRAHLRTRYVQTDKLKAERAAGRALFGAYRNPFTDDVSVANVDRGTANTSLMWHGGKLLALKEAARPVELDPETLATRGTYDFGGRLDSQTFTAHPKIDPQTGEAIAYGYFTRGVADSTIELYFIAASGELERTESFEAPYPSMVHDFLVSENHVAFTICPMVCDWDRVQAGHPFFHWDGTKPTMVGVIPRAPGGAALVRWFKAPQAVMETHTFNAWEDGRRLHLEHFVTGTGWLSQFPDINDAEAREQPPFAYRWTIDLDANTDDIAIERLFPHVGEMPVIDARFAQSKTRHFYFGTSNTALGPMLPFGPKGPPFTCIGHFDAEAKQLNFWYAGPDSSPEEPVFVPRGPGQGDGWLMTIVGRRAENRTDFVILDARDIGAGPVATIRLPCRIHEGFHGLWIDRSSTQD